jgi:hypothetical protein
VYARLLGTTDEDLLEALSTDHVVARFPWQSQLHLPVRLRIDGM